MKILISQQTPTNLASYEALQNNHGAEVDFKPFFIMEPLSAKEFRAEKINLPDYTAVVFSSRLAIDAYFKLSEEMRFKVPETMKYFCSTEAVAMYLQKHIVYRKRKIFYGTGTTDVMEVTVTIDGLTYKATTGTSLQPSAQNVYNFVLTFNDQAMSMSSVSIIPRSEEDVDISDPVIVP